MSFQISRRNLHVKIFFSALFVISITAIIFGSIKSFAQSNDELQNENPIIAASKAEKHRPRLEPSRRLPKRISGESESIFEETRKNDFFQPSASGDLDTTFDTDGKVTTTVGNSMSEAFAVALQPDGKFVAAGYANNASNRDFALVRYEVNGALDVSFGTGGKVTTDTGGADNEILAVAIQADGKIVAAGYSSNGADDDFTLARYNANGTLDSSFGTGGIVKTNFNNSFDYSEAVLIQTDGKIVAAGYSFNGSFYDFALARYNSDGSLDTSFDEDGKVSTSINNFDSAYAVAIQTDGKIVAAGETGTATNSDFALVRYNADGTLDTSFDTDGKVSTSIGSGNEFAEALLIQSSGKIVAAGHSF